MKTILALAVFMSLGLVSSSSKGAMLRWLPHDVGDPSVNSVYSIYLNGEAHSGAFDYIRFFAVPLSPFGPSAASFLSLNGGLAAGVPRPPGQAFTYRNRMLSVDPLEPDMPGVGKGWAIFNPVTSSNQLSFEGGPLSGKISTADEPNGDLFLANFNLPTPSATYAYVSVVLVNEGVVVSRLEEYSVLTPPILFPEPGSAALCAAAFIGMVAVKRRGGRSQVGRQSV
jgi:hypothetical protein